MTATLTPGQTFAGYRIDAVVGRGGMGVVYRAYDSELERPVALKLLAPELAGDARFRERFLRETRIAASLEHPHILPVYAAGEKEGSLFLAMRFVEGEDLGSLLARDGRLVPRAALEIAGQVAEGLDAAHARGLVHRDVKPSNVLVTSSGESYLCDFGLTKRTSSQSGLTASGEFVGTLEYLAPEQIRGDLVDGRADQYALACLLYECLVGEPPFRRAADAQTLWAHMHDRPRSVRSSRPELPVAIDEVFERALAKDPVRRHASCGEFMAGARRARGVGVELPRTPLRPAALRRRAVVIGAALLAVVAVAVTVPLLLTGGDEPLVVVPDSLVRIDPATNQIAEVVPVGRWPDRVATAGPYVFVVNSDDATISRLDTASGRVRTFSSVRRPIGLAVQDERFLWIGSNSTPEVARVDVESLREVRRITLEGPAAVWLAVGGGSLWVTSVPVTARSLGPEPTSRVSLSSGETQASYLTGLSPISVAYGEGASWVLNYGDSTVTRIDPEDGAMMHFDVGHQAADVTVAFGSVWVLSGRENSVWRLNPQTGRPQAILPVGGYPWEVAAGPRAIWVTNDADGTVSRIDPDTNRVVATIETGFHPHGLAVAPDGVWVAVSRETIPP